MQPRANIRVSCDACFASPLNEVMKYFKLLLLFCVLQRASQFKKGIFFIWCYANQMQVMRSEAAEKKKYSISDRRWMFKNFKKEKNSKRLFIIILSSGLTLYRVNTFFLLLYQTPDTLRKTGIFLFIFTHLMICLLSTHKKRMKKNRYLLQNCIRHIMHNWLDFYYSNLHHLCNGSSILCI